MKAIILALLLVSSSAHADDALDYAVQGQVADMASTAVGLAQGAVEANPLGPGALLIVKPALIYLAHTDPDPETRRFRLRVLGSVGWAPVLGNIIGVPTVGAALLLALISGAVIHNTAAPE